MEENNRITTTLDALIFLIYSLLQDGEKSPKLSFLFHQLKEIGLTNEELSKIFGKTPDQIAKTAYEFKRTANNKKGTIAK